MEMILNSKDGFALLRKYRSCVMGFAALCILVFHTWCKIFENTNLWFLENFITRISFFGVDIFFFLSGFSLLFSIQSHSVHKFYKHRFRRLVIPFWSAALMRYALGVGTIWQLLENISGISFYTRNIYSFLWFVPAIATLYLLFPIYYKLFSASAGKTAFTLYLLAFWLLVSIALRNTLRADLYGFTNRIPIFLVGCLAGHLSQQRTYIFSRSVWILLVITLILGLYLSYLTNYQNMPLLVPTPNCCVPNFLITVSVSFLIPKLLELLCNTPLLKLLGSASVRFLSFFGIMTLELYCIQEGLFAIMGPWLLQHFNALMVNVIFFISVTILGIVLWLLQKAVWQLISRLFSVFSRSTSIKDKDI